MAWFSLFGGCKKRIANCNESIPETGGTPKSGEEDGQGLPPTRLSKKRRLNKMDKFQEDTANASHIVLHSNDILFQIFEFFVGDNGDSGVDGTALKNAMLVCRQWNQMANSKALWNISIQRFPETLDSTHRALLMCSNCENPTLSLNQPEEGEDQQLPLIGFQKISDEVSRHGDQSSIFRVKNRATGKRSLLSVSRPNNRTREVLNQVFEAHFFQRSDFHNGKEDSSAFMSKQFPQGVAIISGRVTRWYQESTNCTIFPNPVFVSHLKSFRNGWEEVHSEDMDTLDSMERRFQLCYSFDHLKQLERDHMGNTRDFAGDPVTDSVYWAMIVDWVIEITQCFDLEDRIVFHTMALFRHFMWKTRACVPPQKFQLVASACMLIACKCNMHEMKEVDFIRCSDNTFALEYLQKMEELVLETLKWKLALPTILDFVFSYVQLLKVERESRELIMMQYISELALQSQLHRAYRPSLIAAAVVALSRYSLGESKPLWTDTMEATTEYSEAEVFSCTVGLCNAIDEIRQRIPDHHVIQRRYLQPEAKRIGAVSIPARTSTVDLIAYQRRVTQ